VLTERAQFAASLHGVLAGAPGAARRWAAGDRADGLALWHKLAGLGVTALAVPEHHGGLGASTLDLVVACEELGRHALPGPVAESVAAVPALMAALGDEVCARWLPVLAAGDLLATLALPPHVPYAADADAAGLVLLAETGDAAGSGTVWLAEPGTPARSVDPARSLFAVTGRDALARGPAAAEAATRAFEAGALACAAQLLGAGRALLDASVHHAGLRIQFGRRGGVPGGQAPPGRRGDRAGVRPPAARRRRGSARRWRGNRGQGRLGRESGLHRRGAAGRPGRAPGARRDRLHRRARPAPVAAQGARAGRGLGQPVPAPGPGHGGAGRGAGVELTSEQRDLRDAVRGLLARHRRGAAPAGAAPAGAAPAGAAPADSAPAGDTGPGRLWQRLCGEIGVAGLAIPPRYGGAGAGPVETHIVMEELGRDLVPSPLLGSAVLAGQALLASGDDAACGRLLPGISGGGTVAALAWTDRAGHWDPAAAAFRAARGAGDAWVLTGEAHYVLDGDAAGVLLAAAHAAPDGPGPVALFEVDPGQDGVARRAVTTMDTTRRLAVVRLDGAAGRLLGPAALARVRDLACVALSAEQVGAARRALDLTVGYTKVRVQFGRAIGSFQALQHRMADLHVLVESARSLSYAAAAALAGDGPGDTDPALLAAAARVSASQALTRVAAEMIQMHGAIGITWEHDAHRYFKRAHGAARLFGPPAGHVARIAAAVLKD
jgi:alkylation response protein AidB-like acyl-CoA dehydrogenase